MDIVSTSHLVAEAPSDLEALLLHERDAEGPTGRLFAVGDVGFCGALAAPERDPWTEVGPLLRSGDATFANLETPLALHLADPPPTPFLAPPSAAGRLVDGGLLVSSLANNHISDAGPEGIAATIEALSARGAVVVGAGLDGSSARRLVVTRLGELTVGWLACARTLQSQPETGPAFWELDPQELLEAVRRHRSEVDVLVVSIHWGYMFVDYPHPEHRALTHELAAAGADLVLCHHAHVVQGFETVPGWDGRTAAICHNLGNFLFDWTVGEIDAGFDPEPQRRGVVVAAEFDQRGLRRLEALPTRVDDDWVVRWLVGEPAQEFLTHLEHISAALADDYGAEFRRQRAERNTGLALQTVARRLRRGDLRVLPEVVKGLRPRHAAMLLRWIGRTVRP